MSQIQVQHDSSAPSSSRTIQSASPDVKMDAFPQELSQAQLSATNILHNLLQRISDPSSPYFPRYGAWIQRYPGLEDFCFKCIRPRVWTFLKNRWTLDALKLIGGDLKNEGRAIYLNGVLGLDRRVRIYVGQATRFRQRVAQHLNFRYRRDNPSLHYHAMQQSIYNTFGMLAVLPPLNASSHSLPGMDCPDLLLNVLEMWMCLVFRTLPDQILDDWLRPTADSKDEKKGQSSKDTIFGGLNLTSPLDHGAKQREWVELDESEDPLVRKYMQISQGVKAVTAQSVIKQEDESTQDTPAQRNKKYAESARGYRPREENVIHVPQWMVLGGLVAAVGLIWHNTSGRMQPKPRAWLK